MTKRLALCFALFIEPAFASAQVLPTTRVVGGVTIREHKADAFARAPKMSLATSPVAIIDRAEFDEVALLSDGRVVVVDVNDNRATLIDASGRVRRPLPTGARQIDWRNSLGVTRLRGDTLLIADQRGDRFLWLVPGKGVVRDTSAGAAFIHRGRPIVGVLPGKRIVMLVSDTTRQLRTSPARAQLTIETTSFDGDVPQEFMRVPDRYVLTRETRYRNRPSNQIHSFTFSSSAHVVVWDTLLVAANSAGYRVDIVNSKAKPVSSIRVPATRRVVTQDMRVARIGDDLRRVMQSRGEGHESLLDSAETRRLIREQVFADSLPAYQSILVASDNTLWVVDAIAPTDPTWSATAFRRDGAIIGRLEGIGKGTPLAFSNDRVIVRTVDADGVVALKVYRFGAAPVGAKRR